MKQHKYKKPDWEDEIIWQDPYIPEPRYFRPDHVVSREEILTRLEQLGYSYFNEEFKRYIYNNDNIAVILINIVIGKITALEEGVISPLKDIQNGSMMLLFTTKKYRNTSNGSYKPIPRNKIILL